jgi:hypothetical protein
MIQPTLPPTHAPTRQADSGRWCAVVTFFVLIEVVATQNDLERIRRSPPAGLLPERLRV